MLCVSLNYSAFSLGCLLRVSKDRWQSCVVPNNILDTCSGWYQVQFSRSVVSDLCNPMDCSMPGFPVHHQLQSLLKLVSIELVMPSSHLILCCPLFLLHSIFPSIRVFCNESVVCIRWPKYWSFSFSISISPSNEYSGLISFRIDWV